MAWEKNRTQEKFLNKLDKLSDYYHNLSYLMRDLKRSLEHAQRLNNYTPKQFKDYVENELKLDFDKITKLNLPSELRINDLKKNENE